MPKPNAVSEFLEARGISKARLADVCGVGPVQLSKYVCGARRLNAEQRAAIEVEFGADGAEMIVVFDEARRVWESSQPIRGARKPPVPMVEREVDPPEPDDGVWYTIEEWKAKFGEPGHLVDVHGRVWGYFSTEPDFCEE